MATLRRFSPDDVTVLRRMAERGHDGRTIGLALQRPAEAVRSKATALGIPLRPASLDGRRIKLRPDIWTALAQEARRLHTRPSRLARLVIETCVNDDLLGAVLDLPRSLRRPTKRDPKWAGRLAARQFDVYRL
jgi:hypothetical protein